MKGMLGLEGEYGEWFKERKTLMANAGQTCSVEGCSGPAKCRGMCMKHYIGSRPARKSIPKTDQLI
jgi:hypothetical protein